MTTDNHSVMAFNLFYLYDQSYLFREGMHRILTWFEEGKIHVPEVTTYSLDDVAEAHRALESGQTVGKLVLIP